jgi:transcriptional regulator with XRE-family HTH domain
VPTRDPLLVGLGDAIRTLRFERGEISQERLGLDSGVHRNYIGGIERGERQPTVQTIAKLALALGVAPSQLLARAEREAERRGASWPNGDGREDVTATSS